MGISVRNMLVALLDQERQMKLDIGCRQRVGCHFDGNRSQVRAQQTIDGRETHDLSRFGIGGISDGDQGRHLIRGELAPAT